MATPYKSQAQIKKEYDERKEKYKQVQQGQAERLKGQKDVMYDDMQRQGYVSYKQNQKELPEQLAKLGVVGGGTETTALRGRTNYENTHQKVEKQRGSDKTSIDNALTDTLNQYYMTADENMRTEMANERAKEIAYIERQREIEENRYANTISGWNSVSTIDAEIADLKNRGVNQWKIPYLMAQKAKLQEAYRLAQQDPSNYSYSNGGSGYDDSSEPDVAYLQDQAKKAREVASKVAGMMSVIKGKPKSGKTVKDFWKGYKGR